MLHFLIIRAIIQHRFVNHYFQENFPLVILLHLSVLPLLNLAHFPNSHPPQFLPVNIPNT